MFTGIVAAVGEVRSIEAIGEGRDMRLVIGVEGARVGTPGVVRAGGLMFLPPVASGPGVGAVQGTQECVRAILGLLEAQRQGPGSLVRLGVAVADPGDTAGLRTATTGRMGELVGRELAAMLPAGAPVAAITFVTGLPGGAAVQVEAVARDDAGEGGFLAGVALGASIACSGCCLTVVAHGVDWFAVEASAETLSLTTLGHWAAGSRVNLERALRLGDELGGHMVSGHVDGLGELVSLTPENGSLRLEFAVPAALARFVATKGSVAVDGVSLTVNSVREANAGAVFGVNVIAHTAQATTLGLRRPGEAVHIEVDQAARMAARLAESGGAHQRWVDPRWAGLDGGGRGSTAGTEA